MNESMLAIILAFMAIFASPGIWAAWSQVKIAREAREVAEDEKHENPDLVRSWQTIADNERKANDDLRLRLRERNNDNERLMILMAEWREWAIKLEAQLRLANIPPICGKPDPKRYDDDSS